MDAFELAKMPINKKRSELLDSLRPVLRRVRDSKTDLLSLKNLKNPNKIDYSLANIDFY